MVSCGVIIGRGGAATRRPRHRCGRDRLERADAWTSARLGDRRSGRGRRIGQRPAVRRCSAASPLPRRTAVVIASARSGRVTSMVATTGGRRDRQRSALRRVWSRSAMAAASAAGTAGGVQSCGLPKVSSGKGRRPAWRCRAAAVPAPVMSSGAAVNGSDGHGLGRPRRQPRQRHGRGGIGGDGGADGAAGRLIASTAGRRRSRRHWLRRRRSNAHRSRTWPQPSACRPLASSSTGDLPKLATLVVGRHAGLARLVGGQRLGIAGQGLAVGGNVQRVAVGEDARRAARASCAASGARCRCPGGRRASRRSDRSRRRRSASCRPMARSLASGTSGM